MTQQGFILAIDEGTTSGKALLFDHEGNVVSAASREIPQIYPQPGWVEQNPEEIFLTVLEASWQAIEQASVKLEQIRAIGISNQRETTLVWDRHSGEPVHNAIVWQCRRTASLCEELRSSGLEAQVREKTGLPIDAYFSATKLRWILDHIREGQKRAEAGDLLFGTVDSWLLWKFTGGTVHATDFSNASRTMLFNINTLEWDQELLARLNLPHSLFPEVCPSSHAYGCTATRIFGTEVPISAMVGDQQAALFGEACFQPGMAKNTYGTGSFVLLNIGDNPVSAGGELITTIAWGLRGQVDYALEGSIFVTGAAVQWLRDGLGIIRTAAETEVMAKSVPDNGGVYFVPALAGLGAPYWDMYARGTIIGLTRGTTREHIVRAALEAIAYRTRDVVETMHSKIDFKISQLRVAGAGSSNSFLMQFQADMLGIPIERASIVEITSLGAAYLAGLAVSYWESVDSIAKQWHPCQIYNPAMPASQREELYIQWQRAVERARRWAG